MAKFKISSWIDGINTRINKFRIKESEAVDAVDVDLSNIELKPQKGLDTNSPPNGDYYFKDTWESDSSANKFTETGDYLVKSYNNQNPKFNRRKYNSSGSDVGVVGEKTLGVPVAPDSSPNLSVTTSGSSGTAYAYSSIYTDQLDPDTSGVSDTITTDTGALATVGSAEDTGFVHLTNVSSTAVLFRASDKKVRRRNPTTGGTAQSDVTITHATEYFINGNYFVGLDQYYENVSILELTSGTAETVVALKTPHSGNLMTTANGFSQLASAGTNNAMGSSPFDSNNPTGARPGWNTDGVGLCYEANTHTRTSRGSITSYSANDSYLFVKRNYASKGGKYYNNQYYQTLFNESYKYGSSNTNVISYSSQSTCMHNRYNTTLGGVNPRWEIECGGNEPSRRYPYPSNSSWYYYDSSQNSFNADNQWNQMLLWLVPGFPTLSGSDTDANYSPGEPTGNHLEIAEFIQKLKITLDNFNTATSHSPSVSNFSSGTAYKFNDTVTWSWGGGTVVPVFDAQKIVINGMDYTAILLKACVMMLHTTGNAQTPKLSWNASNETFSMGHQSHAGTNTTSQVRSYMWSSYQKHYAHSTATWGNSTDIDDIAFKTDTMWSWDEDGTNRVWCFPVANRNLVSSSTLTAGTGSNQYVSTSYGYNHPQLEVLSNLGVTTTVNIKVWDASGSGSYTTRFGLLLGDMSIHTFDSYSLFPINWAESQFLYGSATGTNHDFYSHFTTHEKIELATGTASLEITGLKNIALTDGPKTIMNAIHQNSRYSLPMSVSQTGGTTPLETNYIASKLTPTWGSVTSNSNMFVKTLTTGTLKGILTPASDTDSSDDSVAITTTGTSINLDTMHNLFTSYKQAGASTTDVILYNVSGTSHEAHLNVRTAGSTQFGTSQATKSINSKSIEKTNGDLIIFGNSSGTGDNLQVMDVSNNYSVVTGQNQYGSIATSVKDVYFSGGYTLFRTDNNVMRVHVVNSNNNYENWFALPFHQYHHLSGTTFYGSTVNTDNTTTANYKSGFVFFTYEIQALEGTQALYDSASNGSLGSKTRAIYKVHNKTGSQKKIYILFTDDNGFTYSRQAFYFYLSSTRQVKFNATPIVHTLSNVTCTQSGTSFDPNTEADEQKAQVHDNISFSGNLGSGTITTKAVNNFTASFSFPSASGNHTGATATVTRYVSKNRVFFLTADYSAVTNKTDVALATDYNAVTEEVDLGITSTGWLSYNKSADNELSNFAGNTSYFYADLDKHAVNTASADIATASFQTGGSSLYKTGGANIPYQYQYSFLRDISASDEPEMLIEGPLSESSSSIELSASNQAIIVSFPSTPPSEVTKVRVYRTGGEYSSFYKIVDVDVTGNAINDYQDSTGEITSTFITPNTSGSVVPTYLTNIEYASGIFAGSVGSKIYFSEFGNPHSWPEESEIDLYGKITNIAENNGEFIVFTETAIYRVRGYSFDAMTVAKIPFNQGLPEANRNSLVEYKNSLYFISNDGLCFYSDGSVQVMSLGKFSEFPAISTPRSAWKDDVLYIFEGDSSSPVNGVKLDLRNGNPVFSRITQKATTRAFYEQRLDSIYVKGTQSGKYLAGSNLNIDYSSGEHVFGDVESDKVFFRFTLLYEGGATINWIANNATFQTTTLPHANNPTIYKDEYDEFVVSKGISYQISGDITIYAIEIEFDPITEHQFPRRYLYADVLYTGQPQISFYVDNVLNTTNPSPSSLTNASTPKNIRVYFQTDTVGNVVHYTTGGTGVVHNVTYETVML